jgi:hypothetical protein
VALRQVTDGRVRTLALAMLEDPEEDGLGKGDALHLLERNFIASDYGRIATLLAAWRDTDGLHDLGFGALATLEAHPDPEAVPALLTLYDYGPCSLCRERCVDLLHRLDQLPDRILDECQFDANSDLRAKVLSYRSGYEG